MAAAPTVRILVLVSLLLRLATQMQAGMTAARTRETLEALESRARQNPIDYVVWNRIAEARLRRLASTGDLVHLRRAAEAVEQSLKAATPESNHAGLALRVRVELASHRFKEAQSSAEQLCAIRQDNDDAFGLLGDAYFNLGDYAACERVWNKMRALDAKVLMTEPRLAQLDLVRGRIGEAHKRYERVIAAAEVLAQEAPDILAWAHVQLGELTFRGGDWESAGKHYEAALTARPDYYAAVEHMAELRGAQGKLDEAVGLYVGLLERLPRPEFMQALGDLYAFAHKTAQAEQWYAKALAAYLGSAERGDPLYFHHLSGLYADGLKDANRAVEWARKDYALHQGVHACDMLAWALFKAGRVEEARETIQRAVSVGTKDPHILYHAGTILMSAGDIAGGTAILQETLAMNPRYNSFHVHRG
jgi:tetratricopeptide (TPR) repeat protein